MTNSYDTNYFYRYRHQNPIQKIFLPRIDRKEPLYSFMVKYFSKGKGIPKLLDIGCGSGLFLEHAQKDFDCSGIDISKDAVKLAQEAVPNADILVGSFKTLSQYHKHSFDVITCFDVLEHVPDHHQKLSQIYRILKPNGLLAFSAPNIDSISLKYKGTHAFTFIDSTHLWHYSTSKWKSLFMNNNFVPFRTWHGGLIDTPYFSSIPKSLQDLFLKYPTQTLSLYGFPIPQKLGEVVFMLLLKNPSMDK